MKLLLTCALLILISLPHLSAANTNSVRVALVFDDGPFPDHTPRLLDLFAREKIRVSFSVVASNVATYTNLAKAIAAAGHELNNHSYSHRHAKDCTDAELEQEIGGAQEIIADVTGVTPKWYWPPFLEVDNRVRAAVAKAKLDIYSLNQVVVSQDYDRSVTAAEIKRKATTNVKDGSVILFHEWRAETYEQLPAILAELRRQGCVFLTFTELAEANRSKK
jgi:peptidoglycan/xylan/chitin deacetylase (PgdA/CDA1 family)